MNHLQKYVVSAFAAIVLSLTLANVTAMATCSLESTGIEYTCYPLAKMIATVTTIATAM